MGRSDDPKPRRKGGRCEDFISKPGVPLGKDDFLHTRFTLDGNEVTVDNTWGNFQIDGYGTWLWALAQHVQMCGDYSILTELAEPIQTTLRYLELVWKLPNYDCWEEYPEYLHPYSLATVFAGFDSMASLVRSGHMEAGPVALDELAEQVKEFIWNYGVKDGRFVKHIWPAKSDSNSPANSARVAWTSASLGISVPYNVTFS